MAKIEQGILGPFRGKVGNVIGYVRNGVFCMRAMPSHYHDRQSAAQLKNRNRFTMVMKAMSATRKAITLGFSRFASGMTEMNVATRENYYRLVREGANGLEYDYAGLVLSRGVVEELDGVMMSLVGGSVSLYWCAAWSDEAGGEDDRVTLVMVNAKRLEMKMERGAAKRRDGRATMALPNGWENEEVHCYVMVERSGEWSDSRYVGQVATVGMDNLAERDASRVDSEFGRGLENTISFSDQSAIKVLSESDQIRVGKGTEMPPGGAEKPSDTDGGDHGALQ